MVLLERLKSQLLTPRSTQRRWCSSSQKRTNWEPWILLEKPLKIRAFSVYTRVIALFSCFRFLRITWGSGPFSMPRRIYLHLRAELITSCVVSSQEPWNQHLLSRPKKHSKLNWSMTNLKNNRDLRIYSTELARLLRKTVLVVCIKGIRRHWLSSPLIRVSDL